MELILTIDELLIVRLPEPLPDTISIEFEHKGYGELHDLFPRLGPGLQPSLVPEFNLKVAAGGAERLAAKLTRLAATLADLELLGYAADEASPDGVVHLRYDPSVGSDSEEEDEETEES